MSINGQNQFVYGQGRSIVALQRWWVGIAMMMRYCNGRYVACNVSTRRRFIPILTILQGSLRPL